MVTENFAELMRYSNPKIQKPIRVAGTTGEGWELDVWRRSLLVCVNRC